jgi:hypothetical protein
VKKLIPYSIKTFLIIITVLCTLNTKAQTNVTGGIFSNTTWTLAGSPYIITDTIVIFNGITLQIQPGVVVKFNYKGYIDDRGSLVANGTASDSIIFTSNLASPSAGIYNGIYCENSGSSSFRYCRVSYAQSVQLKGSPAHCVFSSDLIGIQYQSALRIDTCTFEYDSVGILDPTIICTMQSCKFINNNTGISVSSTCNTTINKCEFAHNFYGINYTSSSAWVFNSIFNNNHYGLYGNIYKAENCIIDSSTIGIYSEIYSDSISNCNIFKNTTGIWSSHGGLTIVANNISDNYTGIESDGDSITCNTFCNNANYNIVLNTAANDNAKNNYWCTSTDTAAIQAGIYDAHQNIALGLVIFSPFNEWSCAGVPIGINSMYSPTEKMRLYPNPNNGEFTLQPIAINIKCTVQIFNMLGETIYIAGLSDSNAQIDLSNNTAGIYLYRVVTNTGELISDGKFIIQR